MRSTPCRTGNSGSRVTRPLTRTRPSRTHCAACVGAFTGSTDPAFSGFYIDDDFGETCFRKQFLLVFYAEIGGTEELHDGTEKDVASAAL